MKYNYSYVMLDAYQFKKYQKYCERNSLPCNYHQINSDCYGVMIPDKKLEGNIEEVQKKGVE